MDQKELILKLMSMTPEQVEEFLKTFVVTSENTLNGVMTVTKADEFDPASIDFVVCGYARPDAYRSKDAVDVPCGDCQAMIILSPSSPQDKPRLCYPCAQARINQEQSVNE